MIDTATRPPSSQFIGRKRGVFPRLACRGWVANTSTIMKKRGGFPRLACPGGVAKTSTNKKRRKTTHYATKTTILLPRYHRGNAFLAKLWSNIFQLNRQLFYVSSDKKRHFGILLNPKRDCYFFSGIKQDNLRISHKTSTEIVRRHRNDLFI